MNPRAYTDFIRRTIVCTMKRLVLILFSACLATAGFAAEKRPVTLDDSERLKSPVSPAVSPDGRSVVFALDGKLHITSSAAEAPRPLTSVGSAWSPRWSEDGNSLYFVSDRNHQPQIWKLPVATFGEAVQVTAFEKGVRSTNLSPDKRRVLLALTGRDLEEARGDLHVVDTSGRRASGGRRVHGHVGGTRRTTMPLRNRSS